MLKRIPLVRVLLKRRKDDALTRGEAISFLAAVLVVVVMCTLRPPTRTRATRINCVSNLKQMALGFRMWADEHEGQFPMQVSWQEGGSKELTLRGWVAPSFWAASNELNSPKMLVCPSDKKRLPPVTNFASLTDRKISYFLGLDSSLSNLQSVLGGDRNLATNNVALPLGLVTIADPQTAGWTRESLHLAAGNLAFADGSAQQMTSENLRKFLEASGQAKIRVVIP